MSLFNQAPQHVRSEACLYAPMEASAGVRNPFVSKESLASTYPMLCFASLCNMSTSVMPHPFKFLSNMTKVGGYEGIMAKVGIRNAKAISTVLARVHEAYI